MAAESGLRSNVLMELRYRHIMEDLETGTIPVAARLEPRFHVGKKAAGYTFLGEGSVRLLKDSIQEKMVEARPDARLIPRSYYGVWAAIHRAARRIGLDPAIQPCHGLRKYFENALDDANVDHEKKMVLEGHFAGTRAKHYTDREVEQLRELYLRAYPFIRLSIDESVEDKSSHEPNGRKPPDFEAQLARQKIMEAKLIELEDEVNKIKGSLWTLKK